MVASLLAQCFTRAMWLAGRLGGNGLPPTENVMAAEGDLRKKLKARVEAYGGEIRAVAWLGRKHAPDVLCLFPGNSLYVRQRQAPADYFVHGQTVWVETKAPGEKPSAGQLREHERLRAAGCVVLVVSTEAQLDAWLPPL